MTEQCVLSWAYAHSVMRMLVSGLCLWGVLLLSQPELAQFAAVVSLLAILGIGVLVCSRIWAGYTATVPHLFQPSWDGCHGVGVPANSTSTPSLVLLSQPRR